MRQGDELLHVLHRLAIAHARIVARVGRHLVPALPAAQEMPRQPAPPKRNVVNVARESDAEQLKRAHFPAKRAKIGDKALLADRALGAPDNKHRRRTNARFMPRRLAVAVLGERTGAMIARGRCIL